MIHGVGEWKFDRTTGELRRGAERRRLEPRAARTLELLCDAQGAIVPQEQLIADVWGGRTLSENSVPVVISQLRRVLEDDARQPRLIETVPKRGYRLMQPEPAASPMRVARRRILFAVFAVLALLAAGWTITRSGVQPEISATDVINDTGRPALDPLARATSELIVDRLADRGFVVKRGRSAAISLSSKLVIWDGQPYLGMTATDPSGEVQWSAMIPAGPGQVPRGVEAKLQDLEARLAPRVGF